MYNYDLEKANCDFTYIAGIDEVGRGPLAGPVVASCVILDFDNMIEGLKDSKLLSKKRLHELYNEIIETAIEFSFAFIDNDEIDKINIYQASKKAMIEAYNKIDTPIDVLLVDAMKLDLDVKTHSIIKGDTMSASIAAASIVAKVTRDNYMIGLSKKYPEYGFDHNMGYPTKEHVAAIEKYGITDYHRKTFRPVREHISKQIKFDI